MNGCHSRAEFRPTMRAQDGWQDVGASRIPIMVEVPFRMSMDCRYTHTDLGKADKDCAGCPWRVEA